MTTALAGLAVALWTGLATSQQPAPPPSASARATASAAPSASARPTASSVASATPSASAAPSASTVEVPARPNLPPGHVPIGPGGGGFRPPQDVARNDRSLPPGVIEVRILDGEGEPVADAPLALVVTHSSVAKGDSTDRVAAQTDARGRFRFAGLEIGSNVSYRVEAVRDNATFASDEFGLQEQSGVSVLLHAYESSKNAAAVSFDALVMVDVLQEDVQIAYRLTATNESRSAFVPSELGFELPAGAKAFTVQDSGGSARVKEQDGRAVLGGTLRPGMSELSFQFQIPYDGDDTLDLKLPMPPRTRSASVVAPAGQGIALEVVGAGAAQLGQLGNGRRSLTAGLDRGKRGADIAVLEARVTGLPSPGPGRWIAIGLAIAAGILGGGVHYWLRRTRRGGVQAREDLEAARDALLAELAALEKGRRTGELGPKTYERLRNALSDALGRVLTDLEAGSLHKGASR
ncbi:MAG: carboxypeptidase regulatory-like domain-containing protein [Polyangiaceae bacterium]|nr:carboxypeptidase regulatory-like domain-containing protein [Polyangiaceae bacterium]